MINIHELEFSYRSRGPDQPSSFGMRVEEFAVADGSSTALVGPSGSGKTTLLGLIAGTLRADAGSINVNDQVISNFNDGELGRFRISNIGQVFQAFELLSYLTVNENVMLPWYISGSGSKAEMRKRAVDLLHGVGLESKQSAMPGELSQGEQQRVAVCRALLTEPVLLLADEPTGNLDPGNKGRVLDILFDYAERSGATLVTVTHDLDLADRFSRVVDFRQFHPQDA